MTEAWDPDRVAAECAATAREKTRKTTRRKRGSAPPIPVTGEEKDGDAPMLDPEDFRDPVTGRMLPGHPKLPGAGRPKGTGDYKPEYVERVRKWASMGATVAEMASWLDCAFSTFHRWRHEHPEFQEAVMVGREPADNRTERSLYERANGYTYIEQEAVKVRVGKDLETVEIVDVEKHMAPDPYCMRMWLTNRRPKDWKDRRNVEVSGTIEHVSVDEARRELEDFYRNGGVIEATATEVTLALAAPESEEAEIDPASS